MASRPCCSTPSLMCTRTSMHTGCAEEIGCASRPIWGRIQGHITLRGTLMKSGGVVGQSGLKSEGVCPRPWRESAPRARTRVKGVDAYPTTTTTSGYVAAKRSNYTDSRANPSSVKPKSAKFGCAGAVRSHSEPQHRLRRIKTRRLHEHYRAKPSSVKPNPARSFGAHPSDFGSIYPTPAPPRR